MAFFWKMQRRRKRGLELGPYISLRKGMEKRKMKESKAESDEEVQDILLLKFQLF